MTECSPVVAVNAPDFRPGVLPARLPASSTVGHTLPGVSVRIIKPESIAGQEHLENLEQIEPLPANTEGMILVKGPIVMKGYLHRDDLTRKALCDGWYVTGDLGLVDEDGFLKITGRLTRFSKIGGEMVPHVRVEEALNEAIGADEPVFAVTAIADGRDGDRLAVLHTTCDDRVNKATREDAEARPAQPVPAPPRFLREGRCLATSGYRQARSPQPETDRQRSPQSVAEYSIACMIDSETRSSFDAIPALKRSPRHGGCGLEPFAVFLVEGAGCSKASCAGFGHLVASTLHLEKKPLVGRAARMIAQAGQLASYNADLLFPGTQRLLEMRTFTEMGALRNDGFPKGLLAAGDDGAGLFRLAGDKSGRRGHVGNSLSSRTSSIRGKLARLGKFCQLVFTLRQTGTGDRMRRPTNMKYSDRLATA